MPEKYRYDAFISYRHCELDSFVSENLHKKLESYTMPRSIQKKIRAGRTKIERVFRDEAELPLSNNLSDPITEALAASEFLIVICTPNLLQSQWCKQEIETFVAMHDTRHVLLVLAEGEPDDSFPEILMHENVQIVDENGKEVTVSVPREPLAADCRADNDKDRLKLLDNVVLKLCAAMFGLNYDDLRQRHRERQIRRRLIALTGTLAVVTVFALTCLFFALRIHSQNKVISDKYAGAMATASEDLLSQGLRKDALYAVRSVLPDDDRKEYNADAYYALASAVAPYEVENSYFPTESFQIPQDVRGFFVSEDGKRALACCEGYFCVTDIEEDRELCRVKSEHSDYAILNDTGVVYLNDALEAVYLDPETGEETILLQDCNDLFYGPDAKITLVFSSGGITGYKGLDEAFFLSLDACGIDDPDYWVEDVSFASDGTQAAFAVSGFDTTRAGLIDLTAGRTGNLCECEPAGADAVACHDGVLYICAENDQTEMMGAQSTVLTAVDENGTKTDADLAGTGFYDMFFGANGLTVISDRLAYVLDDDLSITNAISGYMDAVCTLPYEEGCVILDRSGSFFLEGLFSDAEKTFSLYGHNEGTISHAVCRNDRFYVRYVDSDRIVIYSPEAAACNAMGSIGDATPFDGHPETGIDTSGFEGIDQISVDFTELSDDGKYAAVSSDDGVLYIFDASTGKRIRELYNTGIVMMHTTFPYLARAGVYILENRVFDENFNLLSRLPRGEIAAIGKDEKSVVLLSIYSPDTYYNVPILTYGEMIKKADALLEGFRADRGICEKYSIDYSEKQGFY